MTEHTPGPLRYRPDEFDDWGFIRNTQGHLVAVATPGWFLFLDEVNRHRAVGTDPSEANARRIVALWNLCDGLSTADLEAALALDSPRDLFAWLTRLACLATLAIEKAPLNDGRTDG